MKKFMATLLTLVMVFLSLPFANAQVEAATMVNKKFDFGNAGVESGYIGVSSKDVYSQSKGYGFAKSDTGTDVVISGGTGVLKDACHFDNDTDHRFYVDLPNGFYKITVTTGDDVGSSISVFADGKSYPQLMFLKGKNATDSFYLPITNGQLAIYPTKGNNEGTHSLCSLEIEQVEEKPVIWVFGDSTVCNYYNVPDSHAFGWGQFLDDYIDTDKYYVHNLAIDGMTAVKLSSHDTFNTAEHFGKAGDILILSIGINDYRTSNISSNDYVVAMTSMVKRAKAKGMTVYLVKQQGMRDDYKSYPDQSTQWYGAEIDNIGKAQDVNVIDLYGLWCTFCLKKTYKIVPSYFSTNSDGSINEIHPNMSGAKIIAEMIANQIFPGGTPSYGGDDGDSGNTGGSGGSSGGSGNSGSFSDDPWIDYEAKLTVNYQAELSGVPIVNPHKGFVMNVEEPYQFESSYYRGIGQNPAWDVVSICSATYFWKDLNPAEGVYNWDRINALLDACEANSKTLGIRIVPYHTGSNNDANYGAAYNFVPQWVYDKGATMDIATYKWKDTDAKIKIPHWSDPIYIAAHKQFIAAFAAEFDGDPRLEYVEIRAFGNFGEWHTSQFNGNPMPTEEEQMDMIGFYKSVFKNTTVCAMSDVRGEVYDYAISIGVAKRNNGLILGKNEEYDLVPAYEANIMTMGDNHNLYHNMKDMPANNSEGYIPWTVDRFRHVVDTAHLSIYSLDLDSTFGVQIYEEQKDLIDEYVNHLGYNFTVTTATRYDNKLEVQIKNTGLASCFFDINLCAEVTDGNGNKISDLGSPILIPSGSFHDEQTKTFVFEFDGNLPEDAIICLAMYEVNNPLTVGKNPTVRFDNKNNLPNNKLLLVETSRVVDDTVTVVPGNGTGTETGSNSGSNTGLSSNTGSGSNSGSNTGSNTGSGNGAGSNSGTNTGSGSNTGTGAGTGSSGSNAGTNNGTGSGNTPNTGNTNTGSNNGSYTGTGTGSTQTPVVPVIPDSNPDSNPGSVPSKSVGDFVTRCYSVALGRQPDEEGYNYWCNSLTGGSACGAQVGYGFIFSAEYIGKNRSNNDFVTDLYNMYFGRTPDEGGFKYWVDLLNNGADRETIFAGFANSLEFYNLCTEYGVTQGIYLERVNNSQQGGINCFVSRLYNVCFNRLPDMGGQSGWVLKLYNGEVTGTSCSYGFIFSPEFIGQNLSNEQFVNCMYEAFFGRAADEGGFNSWVSVLNGGGTYEDVFNGFTGSLEFYNLCTNYGINP